MKTLPSSQPLAEISLPDSDGVVRELGRFWSDNPVVFVWLRHYG